MLPNALRTRSNQFSAICRVCQGSCCYNAVQLSELSDFSSMTVCWLNFTLSLAPTLESSEVGRLKVNLMKKNVASVRGWRCKTWEHQMTLGPFMNTPKRAPSVVSSSVIANVLTLMLCCITMCDTRRQINST